MQTNSTLPDPGATTRPWVGPDPTALAAIQRRLGHTFRLNRLFAASLVYASARFERLEHLGDAVWHLAVAQYLYGEYPSFTPHHLTQLRTVVENGHTQADLARQLGLDAALQGKRPELPLTLNDTVLGRAFEALVGALYFDLGANISRVSAVLRPWYEPLVTAEVQRDPANYGLACALIAEPVAPPGGFARIVMHGQPLLVSQHLTV